MHDKHAPPLTSGYVPVPHALHSVCPTPATKFAPIAAQSLHWLSSVIPLIFENLPESHRPAHCSSAALPDAAE